MRSKFFIILLFLVGWSAEAFCDSLKITINAPQLKNSEVALCSYFNGKVYKKDSLQLSDQGAGTFVQAQKLDQGLYMIYVDSTKYFDVLLSDDQVLQIEIDTTDFIGKNKVSGAPQSVAFAGYVRFLSGKQKERMKLFEQGKALQAENKDFSGVSEKLEHLNKEVQAFQDDFFARHQDQWVTIFFKGLELVSTGPYPSPKTQDEAKKEFYYQKDHYFDNIDLLDKRFWFTNYFPQKIESYIREQVESVPDSLANAASRLVAKTMKDTTCYQLMLSKLTNYALQSNIMGMENVWAKLAEDYYLKGLAGWADSAFLSDIRSEYDKVRYNRIGMQAKDLPLQDSLNRKVQLYNIGRKYTLLVFFEPSCGHCKKEIPLFHDKLYEKYASKGLDVACVYLLTDKKEWLDFVNEHHLHGTHWHNLWDPNRTSYYWKFYNTATTPSIYLLDENKKIIAKRLNDASLDQLLDDLLKSD
ncbi:MAG: AhpC/TSA family protein [Dysgonamonadaceae bacterium]|jgi:peroxiredoxin|nr:AhpC/TSA family protein [Dysgonamonadaceae bacterium]